MTRRGRRRAAAGEMSPLRRARKTMDATLEQVVDDLDANLDNG